MQGADRRRVGREEIAKLCGGCSVLSQPPVSTRIKRHRRATFFRGIEEKYLWGEPRALQPPRALFEWLPPGLSAVSEKPLEIRFHFRSSRNLSSWSVNWIVLLRQRETFISTPFLSTISFLSNIQRGVRKKQTKVSRYRRRKPKLWGYHTRSSELGGCHIRENFHELRVKHPKFKKCSLKNLKFRGFHTRNHKFGEYSTLQLFFERFHKSYIREIVIYNDFKIKSRNFTGQWTSRIGVTQIRYDLRR